MRKHFLQLRRLVERGLLQLLPAFVTAACTRALRRSSAKQLHPAVQVYTYVMACTSPWLQPGRLRRRSAAGRRVCCRAAAVGRKNTLPATHNPARSIALPLSCLATVFAVVLLLSAAPDNHLGTRLMGTCTVVGEQLCEYHHLHAVVMLQSHLTAWLALVQLHC